MYYLLKKHEQPTPHTTERRYERMIKVIYKHTSNGYTAAVLTIKGERIQGAINVNSIWDVLALADRFGAILEKH